MTTPSIGSHMNFNSYAGAVQSLPEGGNDSQNPTGMWTQQPSVYALTFEEFQNAYSGGGKGFGSMNMDELLTNIWTAEETQIMAPYTYSKGGEGTGSAVSSGDKLQRHGSFMLPPTLSQKTVDEIWKELSGDGSVGDGGRTNIPQRQLTLGEMTLEEFLTRVGAVRDETQPFGTPHNTEFFGELLQANNNSSSASFASRLEKPSGNSSIRDNQIKEGNYAIPILLPNPELNAGACPLKCHTVPFSTINNGLVSSPGTRSGAVVRIEEPSMNNSWVQKGGVSMGSGAVKVAAMKSPLNWISSNVSGKSNVDMSPYVFSEGILGRKSGAIEKVNDRRQMRMIKNRESASRSRARKQIYTSELEAEISQLKELNQELKKKQAEILEVNKNQVMEMVNQQWGNKKASLRRTLTGPW